MIAVQKSELRTITFLNTLATICFSVATGFLFLGVEFLWEAYADGKISRDELPWLGISLLCFVGLALGGSGLLWRRKTELDDIWDRFRVTSTPSG